MSKLTEALLNDAIEEYYSIDISSINLKLEFYQKNKAILLKSTPENPELNKDRLRVLSFLVVELELKNQRLPLAQTIISQTKNVQIQLTEKNQILELAYIAMIGRTKSYQTIKYANKIATLTADENVTICIEAHKKLAQWQLLKQIGFGMLIMGSILIAGNLGHKWIWGTTGENNNWEAAGNIGLALNLIGYLLTRRKIPELPEKIKIQTNRLKVEH